MPGNKVKDGIIYSPDKEYTLERKLERFELPADMEHDIRFPAMLETAAKNTARLAAEKYAKIGHHWRSDLPTEVDLSELQISLDDFGSTSHDVDAVNQGEALKYKYNRTAYVVKMWYVVPKIRVEVFDNDELAEADGFVRELPADGEIEENL